MSKVDTAELLGQDFKDRFEETDTLPLWDVIYSLEGHDRKRLRPNRWKGETLMELKRRIDNIPREQVDEFPFERRAVHVVSPEVGALSPTISTALQSFPPGDTTVPHRHPHTANRFVIDGAEGMKAVVAGEEFPIRDYDLILTPPWQWHQHVNDGDGTAKWLTVADIPFTVKQLGLTDEDVYQTDRHEIVEKPDGYHESQYGRLRPAHRDGDLPPTVPYRFAWEDCYETLTRAAEFGTADDPHDGVSLEYVNPSTGQPPVAQTVSHRLQLLREERLDAHKHNWLEVYYVIEGEGRTVVGDETLEWEADDVFFVPPGSFHHHESEADETILFATSDRPVLEAFGLTTEIAKR